MKTILATVLLLIFGFTKQLKSDDFKIGTGSNIEISSKSEIQIDILDYDSLSIEIYNPFQKQWVTKEIDSITNNTIYLNLSNYSPSKYYSFKLKSFKNNISNTHFSGPMIRLSNNLFKLNYNSSIEKEYEFNSNLRIFPNPVKNGLVYIETEYSKLKVNKLLVIDLTGSEVFELNNLSIDGKYSLEIPKLNKGVYIISLLCDNEIITKKLMIE